MAGFFYLSIRRSKVIIGLWPWTLKLQVGVPFDRHFLNDSAIFLVDIFRGKGKLIHFLITPLPFNLRHHKVFAVSNIVKGEVAAIITRGL